MPSLKWFFTIMTFFWTNQIILIFVVSIFNMDTQIPLSIAHLITCRTFKNPSIAMIVCLSVSLKRFQVMECFPAFTTLCGMLRVWVASVSQSSYTRFICWDCNFLSMSDSLMMRVCCASWDFLFRQRASWLRRDWVLGKIA